MKSGTKPIGHPPAVAKTQSDGRWGRKCRDPNGTGRIFRGRLPLSAQFLVRKRIGPHLDVHGHRIGALAALVEPGRAVAAGAPQTPALPAGLRIVDAGVETL